MPVQDSPEVADDPKHELLRQLTIDREESGDDNPRPTKWFIILALLGGLAFAAWYLRPGSPVVPDVIADTTPDGTALLVPTTAVRTLAEAEQGASVLDATGYVVARRQATVSSKATGKVLEVLVEEAWSLLKISFWRG